MKTIVRAIVALLTLSSLCALASEPRRPALDAAGNQKYLVVLDEGVALSEWPGVEAPARDPMDLRNLVDQYGWHKPNVRALVRRLERAYGVKALIMTSHALPTFSAYIPPPTVALLKKDPAVGQIIPLNENDLSFATWSDQLVGGGPEIVPWGKIAIGTNDGLSFGNAVYMIDGGIDPAHVHVDLSVQQGTANPNQYIHESHAVFVAGVLAAQMNTGRVRGVNPGAVVMSVNRGGIPGTMDVNNIYTADGAINAMDWVLMHSEVNGIYGVANFSSVAETDDARDILSRFMRRLSNRVLVVQAAGNFFHNACINTYDRPHPYDGILVVGGIDRDGRPVVQPIGGGNGYDNTGTQFGSQPGSNFGSCVEVWAPSKDIWSTVYDSAFPNDLTLKVKAGGTSFAAPYVAGLAARYGNTSTTPVERERYIRQKVFGTGYVDQLSQPVTVPSYTQPLSEPVPYRLWPVAAYADSPGTDTGAVSDGLYISTRIWNVGHFAPAWIEFDLGSTRCVSLVRLVPEQFPSGYVFHYIWVGNTPNPQDAVVGVSVDTSFNLEPIVRTVGACGQYVRIETTVNPGWVAFREIEILGF